MMLWNGWDIWCDHMCDYEYWCLDCVICEKMHVVIYAWWMFEVELMGGAILLVSMMIMYNDGWLKIDIVRNWDEKDVWHNIVFILWPFDWEVLKWLEVVLRILVKCQCVSWGWLVVEFGTLWLISKKRDEIGMF